MIAKYEHPRLTPLLFDRAAQALSAGLREDNGLAPSRAVLALCLAKTALETGRWQKIWNYNFGNIKAGDSYVGRYTCITLNEVIKGQVKWFAPDGPVIRLAGGTFTPTAEPRVAVPPGHPQTRMRSYANPFDGGISYCDFLRKRPAMWAALLLGEPVAFVRALKAGRYFTADEAPYARAVASLHREFLAKLEGKSPPETRLDETEWQGSRALAMTALARAAEVALDADRLPRD